MKRRHSHIFPQDKDGHYVDPSWVSRRLFEVESFGAAGAMIIDPACGWGTITREAVAAGYQVLGSDIIDRGMHELGESFALRNFLDHGCRLPHNASVVCNPPFAFVEEFCRRALELGAHKVAMITLVRRLNAAHWLRELPLRRVWLLSPRPSMPTGSFIRQVERGQVGKDGKPLKVGGGKQDFGWLIFERGYVGEPTMSWLQRSEVVLTDRPGKSSDETKRDILGGDVQSEMSCH